MLFIHFNFIIFILYFFFNQNIRANVIIKNILNDTLIGFVSRASTFGPEIQSDGFIGNLIDVDPIDACSIVKPPPQNKKYTWIALIQRHNCSFIDKVLNVQAMGYGAAIVYNTESDAVISMRGDSVESVIIPSIFIGKTSGKIITEYFGTNYTVVLTDYSIPGMSDLLMLIPFAIIIPICLIFIIVLLSIRCIGNRLKNSRLTHSQLKRLPLEKFKKGDRYEVCAICLDEYQDGDKLRILPCSHTYHQKCIDPWLTGNKQTCPLCNKPVFNSEDEQAEVLADEQTPLLDNTDQNLASDDILITIGLNNEELSSTDSDDSLLVQPKMNFQSPVEVHNQQQHKLYIDASTEMSYKSGLFATLFNGNGQENSGNSINFKQDWFKNDSDVESNCIYFDNAENISGSMTIANDLNLVNNDQPYRRFTDIDLCIEHNAQRKVKKCHKKKTYKKEKEDVCSFLDISKDTLTNENQSSPNYKNAKSSNTIFHEDNRSNTISRKLKLAATLPSYLSSSFVETQDFNNTDTETKLKEDDNDDVPIIDV